MAQSRNTKLLPKKCECGHSYSAATPKSTTIAKHEAEEQHREWFSKLPITRPELKAPAPIFADEYLNDDKAIDLQKVKSFFHSRVMCQEEAIAQVSMTLLQAVDGATLDTGGPMAKGRVKILSLCGVSGTGKTETVQQVKYLLGMEKGFENEQYCIELIGGEYAGEHDRDGLRGATAGSIGYEDRSSFADKLLQIQRLEERPIDKTLTQRGFCRCILVFIDEVHMAHKTFFRTLSSLLSDGNLTNSHEEKFDILQTNMRMLFLLASNFGGEAITEYCKAETSGIREWATCQSFALSAIRAAGYRAENINRFGTILIYYSLTNSQMQRIIVTKLNKLLEGNGITRKFPRISMRLDESSKSCLVSIYSGLSVSGLGVRKAFVSLETAISNLCTMAVSSQFNSLKQISESQEGLQFFYQLMAEVTQVGGDQRIDTTIGPERVLKTECEEKDADLLDLIKKDPAMLMKYNVYKKWQEPARVIGIKTEQNNILAFLVVDYGQGNEEATIRHAVHDYSVDQVSQSKEALLRELVLVMKNRNEHEIGKKKQKRNVSSTHSESERETSSMIGGSDSDEAEFLEYFQSETSLDEQSRAEDRITFLKQIEREISGDKEKTENQSLKQLYNDASSHLQNLISIFGRISSLDEVSAESGEISTAANNHNGFSVANDAIETTPVHGCKRSQEDTTASCSVVETSKNCETSSCEDGSILLTPEMKKIPIEGTHFRCVVHGCTLVKFNRGNRSRDCSPKKCVDGKLAHRIKCIDS